MVVSGDVYDRALPHVDAVALADDAFARLAHSRASVVVSSGNHDSAQRLGFGSRLMDAAGVFVRTSAAGVGTPVVLGDEHGDVAVHALPYLDPSALLEPWGLPRRSHEAALAEAMTRVRARPGRPRARHPVGRARARVRRRGDAVRVRARHQRRRGLTGGDQPLRRDRLHRAGTPPRAPRAGRRPALQRVAAGLLLLRGRPGQGFLAGGARRRRALQHPLDRRPRPAQARAPQRVARRAPPRSAAHGPRGRLGPGHAHRHSSAGARDGAAASALPPRAGPAVPAPAADAHTPVARRAGRSDHDIALDFIADLRGVPATPQESALLGEAVDACCHDPDQDVLAGEVR